MKGLYIGDYLALIQTIHGYKMYVDTRDLELAPHLMIEGYWEKWITDYFMQLVKPGMSYVEVGANLGYYSVLANRLIGAEGKSVLFEANPAVHKLLHRNVMVNGGASYCQVNNKAGSDVNGILKMKTYDRMHGGGFICHNEGFEVIHEGEEAKIIEVEAVKLDDYLGVDYKVDVMKIDAESSEPRIMAGAKSILENNQDITVIFEYHNAHFVDRNAAEYLNGLRELGFGISRIMFDSSLKVMSNEEILESQDNLELVLKR